MCVRTVSVFSTLHAWCAYGSHQRASDALELELQMTELWVLEMEPRFCKDTTVERSLQYHPQVLFFTKAFTPVLNAFIPVPWAL